MNALVETMPMAKTGKARAAQVRKALEQAFDRIGTPTQVGALCGVSEGAVRYWRRRGNLNGVPVETVLRLCAHTGNDPGDFVIDDS